MARKNKKQLFEKVLVIDTAAKGKTVAKAADGKVIFLPNAVPGDVVDVQTFDKLVGSRVSIVRGGEREKGRGEAKSSR